jgi:hypothetical protein
MYRSRGFEIHESCTRLGHQTPEACYRGTPSELTTPDEARGVSDTLNPYCKYAIRRLTDWSNTGMSFTKNKELEEDPGWLAWRLSQLYFGAEADSMSRLGSAWVEIDRIDFRSPLYVLDSDAFVEGIHVGDAGDTGL